MAAPDLAGGLAAGLRAELDGVLAGHAATRIRAVLAAGHCLTGGLDDALARAEELGES